MPANIRPNRLTISDRFPMLGFTIRTDNSPQKAEVTLATHPTLFADPSGRTPDNFFSTASLGPLRVASGEVVYVVPPEILARFIGSERIYFGLATCPQGNDAEYVVQVQPTSDSPYVSISGLTGRSLRQVRIFPRRSGMAQVNSGYDQSNGPQLRWSGDKIEPGMKHAPATGTPPVQTQQPNPANNNSLTDSAENRPSNGQLQPDAEIPIAVDYDDGFGPMPALPDNSTEAENGPETPPVTSQLGYAAVSGANAPLAEPMGSGGASARRHVPNWRDLLTWTVPASVKSGVSRRSMTIQAFAAAHGDLNLDRYEVRCATLPSGYTAETLQEHIRLNIRDFVDQTNTEFDPYGPADATKWHSGSPVGSVFNLDIIGPDNAAVVASMVEPNRFRFTTIEAPDTGSHPVSGHREFGFSTGENGLVFYTRGADRYTHHVGGMIAFAGADHLWQSFQEKVAGFVNSHGGSATILPRFSERFDWPHVTAVLSGSSTSGTGGHGGEPAASGSGGQRGADGTGGAGAQAIALGGFNPFNVEVKYRMFIPSPAIKGPPFMDDYGGDGRGFSYDRGTSRGEITANVELSSGLGIESISVVDRHWGLSTAYDSDDTFHVSGKPDWWLDKVAGATPTESDTLAVSDDNLRIYPGTSGQRGIRVATEQASAVTIEAAGALPLSRIAPDINADMSVLFRARNGLIQAKALGNHDGFPGHELYVNGKAIYRYDPEAAGNSPTALLPFHSIDADSDWVTVAGGYIVRTGGQSMAVQALDFNESFTLNWDEVQRIAQPTNVSCWAAAAAMVVGWKDRMSLSPATIAEFAGRTTKTGLNPAAVQDLADQLELVSVAPQSYSQAGFRALLEASGPLWVVSAPRGQSGNYSLHAIVVTGIYNDGPQLYVRITDPWDRIVGTPGQPGSYASTHIDGSRYIMTWESFVSEYEAAAVNFSTVNLQIIHSGGTEGRQPNRGGSVPQGYAAALMDQTKHPENAPESGAATPVEITLAAETVAMQPPMIEPVPTAADTQAGDTWNGLVTEQFSANSIPDLTNVATLATGNGWTIGVGPESDQGFAAGGIGADSNGGFFRYRQIAAAVHETPTAQAADTANTDKLLFAVVEGGPEIFSSWVKARAFTASTGTTGAVLLNAADLPVGVAVRLPVGGPYGPAILAITQAVAKAISTPEPGATQPTVPAPTPAAPAPVQTAEPVAAAALNAMPDIPGLPSPKGNGEFPPPGVRIFRSDVERGGVNYSLFLMDGSIVPQMPSAVSGNLMPGNQIVVNDWPYLDGPTGRSKGGVAIDWSYAQGAVANVRLAPAGGAALDGTTVSIHGDIAPGASTLTETKLTVTIRTVFGRIDAAEVVGVTTVTLCGSGKHEISHSEETQPALIPA